MLFRATDPHEHRNFEDKIYLAYWS